MKAAYPFLVFCVISLWAGILWAQEQHLDQSPSRNLYARSSFAHGYIHGYQEGFHHGDLDLQLGHRTRDPGSFRDFKHPSSAYHKEFGSEALFRAGFEDGFRAGYSDVVRGRSFRAVDSLGTAGGGLGDMRAELPLFNRGFKDGYRDGRRQGTNDGRDLAASNPIAPPCLEHQPDCCDGFNRAFLLGYEDGYINQVNRDDLVRPLEARAK